MTIKKFNVNILCIFIIVFSCQGFLYAETITPFTWNELNFVGEQSQGCDSCGGYWNGNIWVPTPCSHHIESIATGGLYSYCVIPGGGDGGCGGTSVLKTTNLDMRYIREINITGNITISVSCYNDDRPAESHFSISITDGTRTVAMLSKDIALGNVGNQTLTVTNNIQQIKIWKRTGFSKQYFTQALNSDPILFDTTSLDNTKPWNLQINASTASGYRSAAYYNYSITNINISYSATNSSCDLNGDGKCTPEDALCAYQVAAGICPTLCGECQSIACDITGEGQCTAADAECRLQQALGIQPNCFDN
jgi:hypothetical protein